MLGTRPSLEWLEHALASLAYAQASFPQIEVAFSYTQPVWSAALGLGLGLGRPVWRAALAPVRITLSCRLLWGQSRHVDAPEAAQSVCRLGPRRSLQPRA